MANQVELPDDEQFWSVQMTEHCEFMSLLFQIEPYRSQAKSLHALWTSPNGDVFDKTKELIAFKELALSSLRAGNWLGWCLPSFLDHILYEAKYFLARMGPGTIASGDCAAWSTIVQGHALIGPKLIDPNFRLEMAAQGVANTIAELQKCCPSPNHNCLAALDGEFQKTNAWVRSVPSGTHILPPTLVAHILRENDRGSLMMRKIG